MSQNIRLKRSAVPGRIPTINQLELGELALNTYDGNLFLKQNVNGTEQIINVGETASLADTASYALSSSYALSASYALTASYSNNSTSSSFALTASYSSNANFAISTSYAATASSADNFTVRGTLTAQTIVAQTITSSTEFITGSTRFGSLQSNTHQFTGSVGITGSLEVNGRNYINDSSSFDNRIIINSSSFAIFSGSYVNESASFDSRINNNSSSVSLLSGSYLASSASFNIRILNNSGSIAQLSGSYLTDSASFSTRITTNSTNISSISASFALFSGSYNTGSFTGSFIGRHTGSFSGSLYNLQNTVLGHIPFYSASQVLADSIIRQIDNGSGSFSIVINQDGVSTAAPEALYVWQPSTTSYNVISGKGNLDSYLQLNIQNTNTGVNASSDIVATANNGNETSNYIDMGINSDGFTGSIGNENDAYLYSTGRHLHIGTATNYPIRFFAGGIDTDVNKKFQLNPNNSHELTGSLSITNRLNVISGVTASLQGTASWANNTINSTSASYALTASYAQNADTASYILNAVSSSYALTASYTPGSGTAISSSYAATASYVVQSISASFASTASSVNRLNQNVVISGSLTVTGSTNIIGNSGTTLLSSNADTLIFTGSLFTTGSIISTGSLNILGGITGSLLGTASYATQALSASYWSGSIINAATASYILNAVSSSYATFALTASNANTASYVLNTISASYAATASSADNFTVRGTLTAQTINVQTITSSIDFVTGSSINGSLLSNTHQFTGSVSITGSLTVNSSNVILSNQTSSMSVLSASYAVTSSYIETAQTASYVLQAQSASYAATASNAPDYLLLAGGTMTGDIYAAGRAFTLQDLLLGAGTTFGKITTDGSKYISIMPTYNVESARFWPNGNVTIQDAGTYVDNGFRLDVSGSGRFTNGLIVTGSLNVTNGITGSLLGTASNAVSASYASTSSYLNPIENSYLILSQVSQSLNFQDDSEAAAGGVPLGGLYRNGNFILIRIV